jgi:hypothetical protein
MSSVVGSIVMEPAYSLPGINTIKYLNVYKQACPSKLTSFSSNSEAELTV